MLKIINRSIYSFIIFISPIFLVLILLLRKKKIIRVWGITANRIGHFAGNVEMFINSNSGKEYEKYFNICYFKGQICNEFLAYKWREKLFVLPFQIIYPFHRLLIYLSNKFPVFNEHIVYDPPIFSRDYNNYIDKMKPTLSFKKHELEKAEKLLKEFGLKKNDKYVCFIVRDSEYLKKNYPNNDWSYWNYRDYDIDKFLPAAEELTKLGFYVFRMGKICKKKINSKNKMIIDYAFSKNKNDFLDIYLGATCEFCLTTDVGYDHIPYIFRRPLASITDPISLMKLSSKKYLNIFSNYYSVKSKQFLNLNEIFSEKVAFFRDENYLDKKGIELKKPDSEDIKLLVLDMVKFIQNNFEVNDQEKEMNEKFFQIYQKNINSNESINFIRSSIKTNVVKLHNELRGKISPFFLIKNNFLVK